MSYSLSNWRYSCSVNGHLGPPLQLCWLLSLECLSSFEHALHFLKFNFFLTHAFLVSDQTTCHLHLGVVIWKSIIKIAFPDHSKNYVPKCNSFKALRAIKMSCSFLFLSGLVGKWERVSTSLSKILKTLGPLLLLQIVTVPGKLCIAVDAIETFKWQRPALPVLHDSGGTCIHTYTHSKF